MMDNKEKYIGKAKMNEELKKPFSLKLGDKVVKTKHIADEAINAQHIKPKSVTPEKVSDDFKAKIVYPYTSEIDLKYKTITEELYSMVRSVHEGELALSGKLGTSEEIGIHQKALTKILGRLFSDIGEITHKKYMDFTLTVQPQLIFKESPATVEITADCTEAISDFDSIQIYVNDTLIKETKDVTTCHAFATIEDTSVIKAVGVIMGVTLPAKEITVKKHVPFFIGSGSVYTDIMNEACLQDLEGTLEGNYDMSVTHDGDHIFIIIPISRKDEFRRADMNGISIPGANFGVEIPFTVAVMDEYVVYKSENTYQAGTYNIDIDINS